MKNETFMNVSFRDDLLLRKFIRSLLASGSGESLDRLERQLQDCNMLYVATDDRGKLEGVCLVASDRIVDCGQTTDEKSVSLGLCASKKDRSVGLMPKLYAQVWRDVLRILDGTGRRIRLAWRPMAPGMSRITALCTEANHLDLSRSLFSRKDAVARSCDGNDDSLDL